MNYYRTYHNTNKFPLNVLLGSMLPLQSFIFSDEMYEQRTLVSNRNKFMLPLALWIEAHITPHD